MHPPATPDRLDKGVMVLTAVAAVLWLANAFLCLGGLSGVTSRVIIPAPGQEVLDPGKGWKLYFPGLDQTSYPARLQVTAALEKEAVHLVLKSGAKQVAPAARSGNQMEFMVESPPDNGMELLNLGSQPLRLDQARLRNYLAINPNLPRMAVLWDSEAATLPSPRLWLLTLLGLALFIYLGLRAWQSWSGILAILPLVALVGPPLLLFGTAVVLKALSLHLELTWESFWLAGLLTPFLLVLPRMRSWFFDQRALKQAVVCAICLLGFLGMLAAGYMSEKGRSLPGGLVQMIHLGSQYLKDPMFAPNKVNLEKIGYDGQFFFYMAQDPLAQKGAWRNIDSPSYRYQRILYPALLYALTGGDKKALPYAMPLLNAAALLGMCLVLCLWCRDLGISRLWGLILLCNYGIIYPAYAGLSEPLANFLLLLSLYLLWNQKAGWAAFSMTLMVLCKEYYVLLPGAALIWAWVKRGRGGVVYAIPIVAGLALQVAIHWRFGIFAFQQSSGNFDWPFLWLVRHLLETPYPSHIAFCIATLLLVGAVLWRWIKGPISEELVLLSLFLLLPLAAGPSIWASENSFMRVLSPAYVLYVLLLIGERTRIMLIPALAFAGHAVLQIMHM